MPIFSSHDKQGRRSINLMHISGMPAPWYRGAAAILTIDEESGCLIIRQRAYDCPSVSLSFGRIFNVDLFSEKETVKKEKSVVKRGITGALIAGPVGAIVGGMSGIGTKTEFHTRRGIAIDIETKNGDRSLIFEIIGATYDPQGFAAELSSLANMRDDQAKEVEENPPPERINGAPLAYQYSVCVNVTNKFVLKRMLEENSWDLTAEQENGLILLSNHGEILGTLTDRINMMSDWLQRGDPYKIVLQCTSEWSACNALLCFYRDKRKSLARCEQSVVSLKHCRSDESQEEIQFCENGDELDIEEWENGSACVYRCGEIIGRLPAAVAKRYFEEDAEGIFFESAQEDDGGVLTPSVRIYW